MAYLSRMGACGHDHAIRDHYHKLGIFVEIIALEDAFRMHKSAFFPYVRVKYNDKKIYIASS